MMVRNIQLVRKGLMFQTKRVIDHLHLQNLTLSQNIRSSSSYVTQMRKSAVDANTLRHLRNEIQFVNNSPLLQPPVKINGFKVVERPGEQWISLEKQFGENEVIKVEVTMVNELVPVPNEGEKAGLRGQKDAQFHISMIVSIFKNNSNQVLEFVCAAWPDTVAISELFVRRQAKVPHQPYKGPKFRELDDELQDSLYEFLEERQIDDSLCVFLHSYVNYKEKAECIRWMNSVKSVMEK